MQRRHIEALKKYPFGYTPIRVYYQIWLTYYRQYSKNKLLIKKLKQCTENKKCKTAE